MEQTSQTPKHRLADVLLGDEGPLVRFVHDRREGGRSWRLITRDILDATGIDLTYETLRTWFPEEVAS